VKETPDERHTVPLGKRYGRSREEVAPLSHVDTLLKRPRQAPNPDPGHREHAETRLLDDFFIFLC
jgi:hypothetical protein